MNGLLELVDYEFVLLVALVRASTQMKQVVFKSNQHIVNDRIIDCKCQLLHGVSMQ